MKANYSISPNIKITQYHERKNNPIHHKSPCNLLNKSQNIHENQKISKINLKNYVVDKKLNKKKIAYKKKLKHHNRKNNSINSNFSIKLNSMSSLPGCFINSNSTYYININTNNNNNNNINNNNSNTTNNINNMNNKTLSKKIVYLTITSQILII